MTLREGRTMRFTILALAPLRQAGTGFQCSATRGPAGSVFLGNESDLANPARPQPLAPEPVGDQQTPRARGVRSARQCPSASADNALVNGSAIARCERLKSSRQRTASPAPLQGREHLLGAARATPYRRQASLSRSTSERGRPSSTVKAYCPPVVSAQRYLLRAARPCLERRASSRAGAPRRTAPAGPGGPARPRIDREGHRARCARDVDGARAEVHPEIRSNPAPE